jgi:uncharacterized membrane protein YkvA (DUF1232 family)
MSSNPNPSPSQKLNVIVALINRARLVGRLLLDRRVPLFLKLVPLASLIYVVMPIDFIPDVIPVLGQLDDIGVVILAVEAFIMVCPQDVVAEHMADIKAGHGPGSPGAEKGNVVDGEWHEVKHD